MTFSIQSGTVDNFTASINEGWYTVTFENPFNESAIPKVFAQIQTRNGADTPGLRLRNITNEGFEVRMDEIIASGASSSEKGALGRIESDNQHPHEETLAWMALTN
ncbi:MAG: hypothetical protein AAF985_12710 [Bacteroidota bacterium]